jgi:hypothetical protein
MGIGSRKPSRAGIGTSIRSDRHKAAQKELVGGRIIRLIVAGAPAQSNRWDQAQWR